MKGFGKFFVGGLLGAIFGFLISPKRAQKVRDALLGRSPGVSLEQPVRVAIPPAFRATPAYLDTDASSPPLPAVPPASFVVVEEGSEPELEPETDDLAATAESESTLTSLAPAESPTAEPGLPALETTSSFTPGRTMEANVLAALVGPSLTLVPPAAEEPADEEPILVEEKAAEVEPEPAPEVLEEATVGTGWSDSEADILGAESVIEEIEPEGEVGTLEAVEPEAPPTPRADPADLRARIEDTRERIRRELELSFAARSQQEAPSEPEPAPGPIAEGGEPKAAPSGVPSGAEGVPRAPDGSFDQEAMRHRIEETRNRLKAKAFDAMMSGEASLLSRDSEAGQRASTAPPVSLDSEVAESIEKTLTEEEF